ncbi:hypothetical protein JOF41_003877 [Saccharothrix coeruleofusca]|uniref:effector-associated domain 2-containing protein n=1 Tax=Saccharothrix coeruleofusca TaxID=33919 RepID=UPI001AE6262E|nr:hypothetical protein [Saccharothrix coeruleofusca]MBP2337699.1 hypothetical protein [Saccharothrix coeruleofusca]
MLSHELPLHHTILVVDVERYGAPERTDHHRAAVHNGLNRALRHAFAQASIDWDRCVVQDGGDGALVLVPASTPKNVLLTDVLPKLAAELEDHNALAPAPERIRLRFALHAGEVRRVDHGIVGEGVIHASRLLDSAELREALRQSAEAIAVIVSDGFHRDVVRHDPRTEPEKFHPVFVRVKELRVKAWIKYSTPPSPQSSQRSTSPAERLSSLVDALLEVPSVREEAGRETLLGLLPPQVRQAVPHQRRPRLQVVELVRTCLDYEDGLANLLAAVRELEGDSTAVRGVETAARHWLRGGN